MFDTMTMTKVVGGVCGSLLVLLLGKWAAETLYHTGGGGHGDHAQAAYVIDTGDGDDHGDKEVVEIDVAAVLAAGDAVEGGKDFKKKCGSCHKVDDGANGTGPYLYGVVGRAVGTAEGFGGYSGSLSAAADVWTPENLFAFLENPKAYAPGNKMSFKGYPKPADRADVIAYLASLGG
ncbi:c-type cytochrome [Pelagimonas varians]|uniref:Cytochrome c-552 n=1 Tax=Pelagimonas varians TaxID=696760 RepID=A0A238K5A8_9RHOB|nr:cytochrome c family protein [Pelagimonas varians]PYG27031.1 cytochrome c [Pelagimonas varians]SMX37116.1 Cytochrome c-552 [Pelagimonas varians]